MNVLIVDDEAQIRRWFDILIRQTGLPLHIAGSCGNGQEALQVCGEKRVDLVITDIKMPVMDGIELIRRLKEEHPAVRTLILSSYSEFHYASEAIKAGARDYILKAEVTVEALREVIGKVMTELEQERNRAEEVYMLKSTLTVNQYALRSMYFNELIRGKPMAVQEFDVKMSTFHIPLQNKSVVLMIIRPDDDPAEEQPVKIHDRELLDSAVVNIVDETLLTETGNGCCFVSEHGWYTVVCNTPLSGDRSFRESVHLYAHRIAVHLQDYLGLPVSIGISLPGAGITLLGRMYEEAAEALSHKRFYSTRTIAWAQDGRTLVHRHSSHEAQTELEAMSKLLNRRQYRQALERLEQFLEQMGQGKMPEAELKSFCLETVYQVQRLLRSFKPSHEAAAPQERNVPHEEITEHSTFWQVKEWLVARMTRDLEEAEQLSRPYSEPIRKVCEFVETSYAEDISLQHAADFVHLNKTYLSELFKKEMSVSFNEYLTKVRIREAQELILAGETRMGMLAEKVGYPDGSYFTKVFKKTTGMTPMEYKQQLARTYENKTK